jgi:hypothetical protein
MCHNIYIGVMCQSFLFFSFILIVGILHLVSFSTRSLLLYAFIDSGITTIRTTGHRRWRFGILTIISAAYTILSKTFFFFSFRFHGFAYESMDYY